MAADGWHVAVSARRADALADVVNEASGLKGRIKAYPLDVTDRAAVAATVASIERDFGQIDQAVLNAGTHQPVAAASLDAGAFRTLIELNLMGTAHCLEAVLPAMIARRGGSIAIVASVAGYHGLPSAAAYGMTKAGLINLAQSLKPELDGYGVHMQIVNPGFVRTPLTDKNTFPMPFLMEPDKAAEAFYRGLRSTRFEIIFPRRLAYLLKILDMLPPRLAFAVTRRLVRAT